MSHPLTDKILKQHGMIDDRCVEGERIFFDDDMRAAYDKGREDQLDKDQEKLKEFLENFSYRGHSADAILELRAFFNNFKSYMEDNS